MVFYALRPDDQEMANLYTSYRGETYFRTRHKHEFWYIRAFHNRLGNESVMPARRRAFIGHLSRHYDVNTFENVLDYGGDRGQMLADGPGRRRFVYEMSDVPAESYVTRISNEQDLNPGAYNLVLLLHVLEHVSYPQHVLAKLKTLLATKGVLFVEVPREYVNIRNIPQKSWYNRYLSLLIKCKPLFSLMYFYSTAMRIKFSIVPPWGFAVAHEHINIFSIRALHACLIKGGLDVKEVFVCPQTGNICAIASLP